MAKISPLYVCFVFLFFFLAYLFQTGEPEFLYQQFVAFIPSLSLFHSVVALSAFLLGALGIGLGIYGRERAFLLWAFPVWLFFFASFLGICYLDSGWASFFSVMRVEQFHWSDTLQLSSFFKIFGIFFCLFVVFVLFWVGLGNLPKKWKEDPFYLPAIGGKEPEFIFPGMSEKGQLPRCLRDRVEKRFDSLNPYFEPWEKTTEILTTLDEGKKFTGLTLTDMAKARHALRLFIFWQILNPFQKVPVPLSPEREDLPAGKAFLGSSLQFVFSLHTIAFMAITLLSAWGTVGMMPLFGQPSSAMQKGEIKKQDALGRLFGESSSLSPAFLSKKYDVIYIYEGDCTKENALSFQKGIEETLKKDHQQVDFLFSKASPEGKEKVVKTTFCFGAKYTNNPLQSTSSQKVKIEKDVFEDRMAKIIVFRNLEGGETEGSIEPELSYNLSKTFKIAKFDPQNYSARLLIAGEDLGASVATSPKNPAQKLSEEEQREKRNQIIFQFLSKFPSQQLSVLKGKLEQKENILPEISKSLGYSLKDYVKYDPSTFDPQSGFPYRVSIDIPRARFSAKVPNCTFLYCLQTAGKIYVRVEYIEFLQSEGKTGYQELRKTDFFVWKE